MGLSSSFGEVELGQIGAQEYLLAGASNFFNGLLGPTNEPLTSAVPFKDYSETDQ